MVKTAGIGPGSAGTQVASARFSHSVRRAVEVLLGGGLVAFPTDTVYGVGALASDEVAVSRLYAAKGRAADKAIPLLLPDARDLLDPAGRIAGALPPAVPALVERFWPGPLSLVVPRGSAIPAIVAAGGDTVAVRVPDHPVALSLLRELGEPLAATSANLSGHSSPLTAAAVLAQLEGRIDLILDGGACPGGVPSTVLDLTVEPVRILRRGPVSWAMLQPLLGDC